MNFNKSIVFSSFIGVIIGALISSMLILGLTKANDGTTNEGTTNLGQNNSTNNGTNTELKYEQSELIDSIKDVYDGVVLIRNIDKKGQVQGTGTGFFYKADNQNAYLATNHHVVEGAASINLLYFSGKVVTNVTIVGSDQISDIAVLKINKKDATKILKLGNSDSLVLGQSVFTVGSPLGEEFINTVTHGIVSGTNRSIDVGSWDMAVLQTDAPINPGNSGGPLINLDGEVVGINSLKIVQEQVEGMGFSIPINDAINYIESIEQFGKVVRPTFGIQTYNVADLSDYVRGEFSLPDSLTSGVLVYELIKDGPALKSGIKKGDVIISLDGKLVSNINDFRKQLYTHKPGDQVEVEIMRDGKKQKISVTLDTTPIQ